MGLGTALYITHGTSTEKRPTTVFDSIDQLAQASYSQRVIANLSSNSVRDDKSLLLRAQTACVAIAVQMGMAAASAHFSENNCEAFQRALGSATRVTTEKRSHPGPLSPPFQSSQSLHRNPGGRRRDK